jgi:NADPH:quinone reductase-like Zn-dependent oxidoreductase
MGVIADAWFLYAGQPGDGGSPSTLIRSNFELPPLGPKDVLAEPLFGCWEGNMTHAVLRKPIDICRHRGEERVVIGNAGVVRVLEVGSEVTTVEPGQRAMTAGASVLDQWGYPEKIMGYDAPGTMGCLSTRMQLQEHELVAIPESTQYSLAQWAAFAVRFVTAWSNWELAYGTFRLLVPQDELPEPHVWGWGGGTTLAELSLAARFGCRTVMLTGNDHHLRTIESHGVTALDRRTFDLPAFDEARFASDGNYRRQYNASENAFLREVKARTGGEMVHIFVDYIGSPVLRATLKALAREGVITTAGWKEGMATHFLRSSECIARHQHIHTHYARRKQVQCAMKYGEHNGWMPILDEPIVSFDQVPELCARCLAGSAGYFPVFSVNPQ